MAEKQPSPNQPKAPAASSTGWPTCISRDPHLTLSKLPTVSSSEAETTMDRLVCPSKTSQQFHLIALSSGLARVFPPPDTKILQPRVGLFARPHSQGLIRH